jgi:hypothetical protein
MTSVKRLPSAKLPLKIPINRLQFAFRAAALTARIFGLKVCVVALSFYAWRLRTTFVHALALGAAVADLTQGDSGSCLSLGAAGSLLRFSIARRSAGNGLSLG